MAPVVDWWVSIPGRPVTIYRNALGSFYLRLRVIPVNAGHLRTCDWIAGACGR